jgi:hypothetical protein
MVPRVDMSLPLAGSIMPQMARIREIVSGPAGG